MLHNLRKNGVHLIQMCLFSAFHCKYIFLTKTGAVNHSNNGFYNLIIIVNNKYLERFPISISKAGHNLVMSHPPNFDSKIKAVKRKCIFSKILSNSYLKPNI